MYTDCIKHNHLTTVSGVLVEGTHAVQKTTSTQDNAKLSVPPLAKLSTYSDHTFKGFSCGLFT